MKNTEKKIKKLVKNNTAEGVIEAVEKVIFNDGLPNGIYEIKISGIVKAIWTIEYYNGNLNVDATLIN